MTASLPNVKGASKAFESEWLEKFRAVIMQYHRRRRPDPFMDWFRQEESEDLLGDLFSKVLLVLVDARFDQAGAQAEDALKNTIAVFGRKLIRRQAVQLKEIPLLAVPPKKSNNIGEKMTADEWAERFRRAHSALVEKADRISDKREWSAAGLRGTLTGIPDMGPKTSRLAIRWLHELIHELKIDMISSEVPVDSNLYRVAARLGIIDPYADKYSGEGSPADIKIQEFARTVFPSNPSLIDEPLWTEARISRHGGHCHPRPQCNGCTFEGICPRNHANEDPSAIGGVA